MTKVRKEEKNGKVRIKYSKKKTPLEKTEEKLNLRMIIGSESRFKSNSFALRYTTLRSESLRLEIQISLAKIHSKIFQFISKVHRSLVYLKRNNTPKSGPLSQFQPFEIPAKAVNKSVKAN